MILPATVRTLVGAHRGASADAPENTMAAFERSIADGAELIELDVHTTLDGKVVVHHDFDLKRTAGSAAAIRDLTLREVLSFDVGSWKGSQYAGLQIPLLEQVFKLFGNRALLNVEIKFDGSPYREIELKVARLIREHGLMHRVAVSSFDLETALRLRRIDPDVRVSLLHESLAPDAGPGRLDGRSFVLAKMIVAREYGMVGIHLDHGSISMDLVTRARELELGVLAWTVDDEAEMRRLVGLGIDAIVSNRPSLLRSIIMESRPEQT
jgi:glycerophosphoryl diester phosphodiesterase